MPSFPRWPRSMSPVFAIGVVLSLALGLGANAAMFSFLDRVYLRPPNGVDDPRSLRRFWTWEHDRKGVVVASHMGVGTAEFAALSDALRGQASLSACANQPNIRLGDDIDPPTVTITRADASYLPLLGVHVAIGRAFSADE